MLTAMVLTSGRRQIPVVLFGADHDHGRPLLALRKCQGWITDDLVEDVVG
jgi:hypothetical protein